MILYGVAALIIAFVLNPIIAAARERYVESLATDEELNPITSLPEGQRHLEGKIVEQLRAKYSPTWLNLVSLIPLLLLIVGIVLLVIGAWRIEPVWLKFVVLYLIVGVVVTTLHIGSGEAGAAGLVVTVIFGLIGWPLLVYMHASRFLWKRRFG